MSGLEPLLLLAGTGMSVAGQISESNTQSAIAEANAKAEERRAMAERAVASVQAERRQKAAERLVSEQRARFAASGGGLGGSAAEVMAETEEKGAYNSALEMWQGEEKARGLEDSAAIARAASKAQRSALPFKIGATILTGGAKAYGASGGTWDFGGGDVISEDYDPDSGWRTTTRRSRGVYY